MMKQRGYGLVILAATLGLGPGAIAGVVPNMPATSRPATSGPGMSGLGMNGPGMSGPGGQRGAAGKPIQGYLGIDVRDVAEDQVSALRLHDARGAEITKVDHDGPAGKMGLRAHDVVLQMNGIVIEGEDQIRRMLHDSAPGKQLVMVISREGQQLTVTAQLADKGQLEKQAWEQHLAVPAGPQAPATGLPTGETESITSSSPAPASRYSKGFLGTLLLSPSYTGAMLEMMGPQLAQFFGSANGTGLLVRSVENNSPAAMAGIKAGDVVIRADTHRIASMSDWAKTIRNAKGRPVAVVVLRDKQERTFSLTPDSKKRAELELPYEPETTVRLACLTEL